MPKRESDEDRSSSASREDKKPRTLAGSPKKWSVQEEAMFLEAIDRLAKSGLWNELKGTELAGRGANGVRSHWDAMYKKMKKG